MFSLELAQGVKEVEEAKKSAVAIAVLLVLIQPLSLAVTSGIGLDDTLNVTSLSCIRFPVL